MDRPEAFADSFPQPRNDEPASLRQDIADELADHLQNALRRQLLTTPDETSARLQVVDRFGDPQRLARQLWFEAMQEKIMRPLEFFLTNHYLKTVRIGSPVFPILGDTRLKSTTPRWLDIKSAWHFLPEDKRIYPGTFDYCIAGRDLPLLQTFNLVTRQDNEWQLSVPEEFWTQVRADLERAERVSKATPTAPVATY